MIIEYHTSKESLHQSMGVDMGQYLTKGFGYGKGTGDGNSKGGYSYSEHNLEFILKEGTNWEIGSNIRLSKMITK